MKIIQTRVMRDGAYFKVCKCLQNCNNSEEKEYNEKCNAEYSEKCCKECSSGFAPELKIVDEHMFLNGNSAYKNKSVSTSTCYYPYNISLVAHVDLQGDDLNISNCPRKVQSSIHVKQENGITYYFRRDFSLVASCSKNNHVIYAKKPSLNPEEVTIDGLLTHNEEFFRFFTEEWVFAYFFGAMAIVLCLILALFFTRKF